MWWFHVAQEDTKAQGGKMSPGFSDTRAALFPPLHTASCGADTVGDTGWNFALIGDVHSPNSAH